MSDYSSVWGISEKNVGEMKVAKGMYRVGPARPLILLKPASCLDAVRDSRWEERWIALRGELEAEVGFEVEDVSAERRDLRW